MTENEYRNSIYRCENKIDDCYYEIRKCEDQIDDLQRMKLRIEQMERIIDESKLNAKSKIDNIVGTFAGRGLIIRGNFFSDIKNIYSGYKYRQSISGLHSSIRKIERKLDSLEREIVNLYKTIEQCERQITEENYAIMRLKSEEGK